MIGRTHGVHAEPMTLGVKLALWYAELQRDLDRVLRAREIVSVGKISGAVGMFAHLDPAIEARSANGSGSTPAPVSSQVIQRDRHAELLTALAITAASLEKFALEIRGLQKTEIGESRGAVRQGPEGLVGDAAQAQPDRLRADHRAGAAAARQRHGRARERRAVARARHLALVGRAGHPARQLHRARPHAAAVHPDRRAAWWSIPERMKENLERSRGVVFSGTVLLELARRGISREQAYEWVQRNAMRAFHEQRDFKTLLLADADLTNVLTAGGDREGVRSQRALPERRRDFRSGVRVSAGGGSPSGVAECSGDRRDAPWQLRAAEA